MAVLLVGYDLNSPGQNYDGLIKALEQYHHCHALDSMWFIDAQSSPSAVRDHLRQFVNEGDQVYVMRLRQNWAASFTDDCTRWLKSSVRTRD